MGNRKRAGDTSTPPTRSTKAARHAAPPAPRASTTTTNGGDQSDTIETTWAALQQLTALSPDPLLIINQQGVITLVNAQAAKQFGYAPDELLGASIETLLPERVRSIHLRHRAGYLAAPHMRPMGVGLDLVGRRQDGSEFPVDISLRPCQVKGQLYVMAAVRDVSAQRRWERERADLLERLRLQSELINLAHDAILVRDAASRILSWNTGAEELYGWSVNEALGQVSHLLFRTRFPSSRAAYEAQLARDGSWEGELTHTRPDGRTLIVESRQALVRDADGQISAILEINRDITERRQLEEAEALTQASALARLSFLQQLVDALPNGVYVVHGQDARLVLANRAAQSAFGAIWRTEQPISEFFATHGLEITDPQGRPLPAEQWATLRALRQGETTLQFQETLQRPSGESLPILASAVPLTFSYWQNLDLSGEADPNASHPSSASAPADRRGRAASPAQEPLALVIQQDVRTLREMEYLKDEFIGLAAHELRTPVAALKGAVETLLYQSRRSQGTRLADWQTEMLQEIDLASDRLTDLTDDLLDVTRLQAGQLQLHLAPTDLVALTNRVVGRIQHTAPQRRLVVEEPSAHLERDQGDHGDQGDQSDHTTQNAQPESPEPVSLVAIVDAARIEQVLDNLITNALKYSPVSSDVRITLIRHAGEAGAPNTTSSASAEWQVQDAGMGIPAGQQSRIFGRFMRADNARQAGIHGTGLGLYISRGIIEQHGGHIWFVSEEGKGTTFFLALPLAP
jgi:PAS domain S-box-containing protein